MKRFVIDKDDNIRRHNCVAYIENLPINRKWVVEIKQFKKSRSIDQNAYLHGVPLTMICQETGYDMEDMKTYLLGEYTGWVTYEMFGQQRKRPVMRSHEMNTQQMNNFFEWIMWWASENLNMIIPEPNSAP